MACSGSFHFSLLLSNDHSQNDVFVNGSNETCFSCLVLWSDANNEHPVQTPQNRPDIRRDCAQRLVTAAVFKTVYVPASAVQILRNVKLLFPGNDGFKV
jgi:hypothetical protein